MSVIMKVRRINTMDFETILSATSTVGFPIVAVILLGYFTWKSFNITVERNREREDMLVNMITEIRAELSRAVEVNASFIKTLEKINGSIKSMNDDIDEIKTKLEMEGDNK